jgi:hypothetical protein
MGSVWRGSRRLQTPNDYPLMPAAKLAMIEK